MMNTLAEVVSKPKFLEVNHTDFYSHVSLVNNIAIEDKLEIVEEFDNSSSIEASVSEFDEIITANIEKKLTSFWRICQQSMSS